MEMSIKFTTAEAMVHDKISRNLVTKEVIDLQRQIFEKEIKIREIYIATIPEKLQMIDNMNEIEKMQLKEYTKERENSTNEIIALIKEVDQQFMEDLEPIKKEIIELKKKYKEKNAEFDRLDKKIPDSGNVTNCKIKQNIQVGSCGYPQS